MKFNELLKNKFRSWKDLEKQIELLTTTKQKGDIFEEFVFAYFNLNKTLYQISEVYPEKNIPLRYKRKFNLEKKDCGVDGLIVHKDGTVTGYQVKFRANRKKPTYDELAKFWAEARKTDHHLTIANCYSLSKLCAKHKKHLSLLVDEFDSLSAEFFNEFYNFVNAKPVTKKIFQPFDYQKRMIKNTLKGFKTEDRGKLIAACGVGKTFTALKITESMDAKNVLFLAPSLTLIKQTLESWAEQSADDFSYICVCSDATVSDNVDSGDISIKDFNIPVTTSVDRISEYLFHKVKGKKFIFSTYQSLNVLSEAMKKVRQFEFDITIFDEAHRTAGAKNSGLFALGLDNNHIRSKKRLFMTATERLLKPWIVKKAEEYNRTVFSMDNKLLYGPVFDRFNFGEAISENVISDYKIVVAGVKEKEVYDLIKKDKLLLGMREGTKEYYSYAQNIFRQILLIKAMQEFPIRKTITFHSTIKNANAFIKGVGDDDISLKKIINTLDNKMNTSDFYIDHINGSMSAGERREILDLFKESDYGIISNARCLTEGIDLPVIDSIYFVNPKSSLIDIVQACGRALRRPHGSKEKTAYFIIPILIPEGKVAADILNEIDFEMLHNLIQSLRDQDLRLAEWVNHINLRAAKGKSYRFSKSVDTPIILDLPQSIDIKKFEEKLYLRIAEVNGEPTPHIYGSKKYGKKERKSDYKRVFKTLGDYSVESYKKNLVMPTIKKFKSSKDHLRGDDIKINHNNVSHTERLGLIEKENKKYLLTPLGIQLLKGKVTFEQIFMGQMLRYYSIVRDKNKRILFPYRACLRLLIDLKSINYIEFVFGLYSMVDYSEASISEAIEGVKFLRAMYPNINVLNEKNKIDVLKKLNNYFDTNFSITDIWEKKTTINNQFIYFRNHLSFLSDSIECNKNTIKLKHNRESKIVSLLMKDQEFESESDETKLRDGYIDSIVIFMLFEL